MKRKSSAAAAGIFRDFVTIQPLPKEGLSGRDSFPKESTTGLAQEAKALIPALWLL